MKKGFTLIELLAVIVILAIIALIATPIVLSIINDTKESATLRNAEYYLTAVEQSIMNKNLTADGSFSPNTCEIQGDGNLLCDGKDTLEVEVNGETPTSGTITFDKGQIRDVELTLGNKNVVKNEKGELVLGEAKDGAVCKLIEDVDSSNTITAGDKYQCKVKDNMEEGFEDGYYFFVLSHNSDGTTNLIMDRNINSDGTPVTKAIQESDRDSNGGIYNLVAWNNESGQSTTAYGPVTAMNFLHNATKDWNNVPNMIMNYDDENIDYNTQEKGTTGYGTIITTDNITKITDKNGNEIKVLSGNDNYINLKARIPRYDEISGEGKCVSLVGSCPLWLSNYLSNSQHVTGEEVQNINGIYGYWTLFSYAGASSKAGYLRYVGSMDYENTNNSSVIGIRPVITLKI